MPYSLQRSGRGYYVVNKDTGRRHSNRPLPKARAMAQMRALYAVESGYVLRSRARKQSPYNVRAAKRKARSGIRSLRGGRKSAYGGGITGPASGGASGSCGCGQ